MISEHLRVKFLTCKKCRTPNSWEVVVRVRTYYDGYEQNEVEDIIGYKCHNCGIAKKIITEKGLTIPVIDRIISSNRLNL